VELYLKVRLAVSEGMTRRQAAKHFNISRDSVAKMVSYSTPPGYQRQLPIRRPKLDAFVSTIDHWLDEDVKVPRKQRHTAKRVFDRLRDERGFTGGYTIIKGLYARAGSAPPGGIRAAGSSAGPWAGRLR
jgi:transposase